MTVQEILEAIAALTEVERLDLLSRLREIYAAEPRPAPLDRAVSGDWDRRADFMLVFDGGSQGNPGPAYGSYAIVDDKGEVKVERLSFDVPLTNNEAGDHTLLAARHPPPPAPGRRARRACRRRRARGQPAGD